MFHFFTDSISEIYGQRLYFQNHRIPNIILVNLILFTGISMPVQNSKFSFLGVLVLSLTCIPAGLGTYVSVNLYYIPAELYSYPCFVVFSLLSLF
jgi:hypothetical protein